MQENEQNPQNDFMIEKIKERPINKRKLIRRTVITAAMAVIFGLIACVTFLVLEPVISNRLHPEEEPPQPAPPIVFPEDPEEMSPEDMLADNIPAEEPVVTEQHTKIVLDADQIRKILSNVVLNKENYRQIYNALSKYADTLNHSIVTVTGISSNVDWFNNVEESKKQSSGLILVSSETELFILADYTPLQKAESLTMTFSFLDAETAAQPRYNIPVTVKAVDSTTNLAILSTELAQVPSDLLDEEGLAVATLGYSNAKNMVGTPVIAVGSPMGTSGSMGYGMITAVTRLYKGADTNYKMLQTDIFGSQNAGGILFNLQGQVVGIITNRVDSDMKNIICAYGITELKKRMERMSNGIAIAYMGISGMDVTEEAHRDLGVPYGAFVRDIDMNSPAMHAGIQKGDVLTAFGDTPIETYNDYINALMEMETGSVIEIKAMRAAQGEYREMSFQVELGVAVEGSGDEIH